jgi:hypothetical protein
VLARPRPTRGKAAGRTTAVDIVDMTVVIA